MVDSKESFGHRFGFKCVGGGSSLMTLYFLSFVFLKFVFLKFCISQVCGQFEVRDLGLNVLAMVRGWLEGSRLCLSWPPPKAPEQKAFFGLCL